MSHYLKTLVSVWDDLTAAAVLTDKEIYADKLQIALGTDTVVSFQV